VIEFKRKEGKERGERDGHDFKEREKEGAS